MTLPPSSRHDGVFRGGVKVCYALTDMDAPMSGMPSQGP